MPRPALTLATRPTASSRITLFPEIKVVGFICLESVYRPVGELKSETIELVPTCLEPYQWAMVRLGYTLMEPEAYWLVERTQRVLIRLHSIVAGAFTLRLGIMLFDKMKSLVTADWVLILRRLAATIYWVVVAQSFPTIRVMRTTAGTICRISP